LRHERITPAAAESFVERCAGTDSGRHPGEIPL